MHRLTLLLCAALLFSSAGGLDAVPPPSPEWNFQPPAGSGVVNVKDYGAKGDGVTDDSEAIARAISGNIDKNRYRANPMIFLPKGTYLVSRPIESRVQAPGLEEGKVWSAGWRSMLVLIGESRTGTVIKLADHAPGYGDAQKPKWVLATGSESDQRDNYAGGGNRAFRHAILNLTIDVGAGNPGAIAIDFVANNRGSIDGVTLRAAPGSGHTGIGLTRPWPGPAIVQDVRIEGFARGIALDHYQYGMTFEGLEMTGQREVGIANTNNVVAMRHVRFTGSVPFYRGTGAAGMLCLLDSTLTGEGAPASAAAAISSAGLANLRRVTVQGFATAFDDTSKANLDIAAALGKPTVISSYDQGVKLSGSGGAPAALDLPIAEIPTMRPPLGSVWRDGGTSGESLQAAIDSGAEWIYVKPVQPVTLAKTLILRGKVRLILGLTGWLVGPKDAPAIRVENGEASVVVLEQIGVDGGVEQASDRTLVIRHGDLGSAGLNATGAGQTHIIDVIGRNYHIGPRHTLFARQLNAEFGSAPLLTNAGTAWILGFKMETSPRGSKDAPESTPALLNQGGKLEMFGGLLYTLGTKREHAPAVPAFTNEHGKLALSYRVNGRPETLYRSILRRGAFTGSDDLLSDQIKGFGAALLSDER